MDIEQIYHRQVDTVYRVAMLYLKNAPDAEDATQTTFIRLMDHPVEFESQDHERAWLIVTVSNLCKNQLSNWFKKKRTDFEAVAPILQTANPEYSGVLEQVVALPDDLKTIIYMYYYEGYSTKEISRYLNLNESTLRSRMQKARELLRLEMEDVHE